MSLFVIADLHLSFGCNKPMDVFPGWKDYTQRLEQNWRSLVKESDTVVIAGDISWAMKLEETEQDFSFIHRLPGQKILMKGNHDYWWSTKSKIERFLQEKGFTSMKVLHNNAYIVEDVAVCGTRGWLYNSETEEDVKIVNREVGRLVASLNDAAKPKMPMRSRLCFCIIRLYTEIWRVREFWMYWKHVMLNNAILGIFMATKHPKRRCGEIIMELKCI